MAKDPAKETDRKTAKIIQFPVRLPLAVKHPEAGSRGDAWVGTDAGEAWYHEAALHDATLQDHVRHPAGV